MLTALLADCGASESGCGVAAGNGWGMMGQGVMGPWLGSGGMMNSGWWGLWGILCLVTWVLVILVLLALFRWLWKKGSEK